ncbi:MAG: trypsin-like peptidase domain-containing protein [Pseudomonadota bacterium]
MNSCCNLLTRNLITVLFLCTPTLGTSSAQVTPIPAPVADLGSGSSPTNTNDPVNGAANLYISSQPYIVSIEIRTTLAGYSEEGTTYGTGAILDKDQGYILTNAHVAKPDGVIDHYDVTLHDGTVIQAQLLYADPWHDFAILKADPNMLKSIPNSMPTKRNAVHLGEPVLIIGKNENNHFSSQTGTIASAFETSDVLPGQVFRISLNAQGGASGSPIFNKNGKVIGFLYASNGLTSAFAIPIDYALDALEFIKQGKKPPRFGTGAILGFTALEDLVRYDSFPTDKAEAIKQKFPLAFSRVLNVRTTLKGSPAEEHLMPGDTLIKINGNDVGPSLYSLDRIANEEGEKGAKKITFEIIRHGETKTIDVGLYDLNAYRLKRMLHFGKAVFYEVDDEIVRRTNATRGVFVTNRKPGGGFHDQIPAIHRSSGSSASLVSITNVDGTAIENLDQLIKLLPELMKKKDFYIKIRNFGAEFGYNNEPYFVQNEQIRYIPYRTTDGLPEFYTFNEEKHNWEMQIIQPQGIQP